MDEMLSLKSWIKLDYNLNTLVLLPDETLISLVQENSSGVLEMITYFFSLNISAENKMKMIIILQKFLKILPPDDKKKFVGTGIATWFNNVIPEIISLLTHEPVVNEALDVLDILSNELTKISDRCCPYSFLEDFCSQNKYPQLIISLLNKGSPIWHRLWIVIIKLLNQQVTTIVRNKGTPLNSMLPVVEAAFKLDTDTRYRAFLCWNELIDIFSRDINDSSVPRRIKLLMVPLKVNNAKAKETAQAKFTTWWQLIVKFKPKIENHFKEIVIPFLHYCFGKNNTADKLLHSHFTYELKMECAEAFVELTGHVYCDGCTKISKLNGKLLCTKYLVNYWKDWANSLRSAILIIAENTNECSNQQVRCMWKSFLLTIGEMPDNSLRKDLVLELLNELDALVKECNNSNILADIVFNSMILSAFDDEPTIKHLFKTIGRDNYALKRIITLMVHQSFTKYYNSISVEEAVRKLKPVMDILLDESLHSSEHIINWILKLPVNDNMLILWTALAKSVTEFDIDVFDLCNMLLWPLINMNKFGNLKLPALPWYTLYTTMNIKIRKNEINEQISNILLSCDKSSHLMLCACLAILKHDVTENSDKCERNINLLQKLNKDLKFCLDIKGIFPILVDTLVILLNSIKTAMNDNLTQSILVCIKNVLNGPDVVNQPKVIIENLLKSVKEVLKMDSHFKHISLIENELQQFLAKNPENESLKKVIESILNRVNNKVDDSLDKVHQDIENNVEPTVKDVINANNFSKPKTPKSITKKEVNIINTIVENGEEYVVVKSNWKFNPKKLTENQKEKLQKKREDIPALYQDLSQSQDEFKKTLWGIDSHDASNSSKSVNDVVSVINASKSSEIVSKVSETILMESIKNVSKEPNENSPTVVTKAKQATTPRSDKSSRMAIKDRIFRNVKMLTQKSTTPCNNIASIEAKKHVDSMGSTPQSKPRTDNVLNSAPPLLADRPTRVKRMPKKYDNTEIFAFNKKHLNKEDSKCSEINIALNKSDNMTENQLGINAINNNNNSDKMNDTGLLMKENLELLKDGENVDINEENYEKTKVSGPAPELILNCVDKLDNKISETMNTKYTKPMQKCFEIQLEKPVDNDFCNNFNIKTKNDKKQSLSEHLNKETGKRKLNIDEVSPNITLENKECKKVLVTESTPILPKEKSKHKDTSDVKSSVNKRPKISRIEKELAIDMVEDHLLLKSDKRLTRKSIATANVRTSLADKLNKTKGTKNQTKVSKKTKVGDSTKIANSSKDAGITETFSDFSQSYINSEDLSCSEDIIESSQDSTFTAISVTKKTPRKELVVKVNKINNLNCLTQLSQDISQYSKCEIKSDNFVEDGNINKIVNNKGEVQSENSNTVITETESSCKDLGRTTIVLSNTSTVNESKDDTEFPENKTAIDEKSENDLTENMDTESFENNSMSSVVLVDSEDAPPIIVSSDECNPGPETQEIAQSDTQPIDSQNIFEGESQNKIEDNIKTVEAFIHESNHKELNNTQDDSTRTMIESFDKNLSNVTKTDDVSSPFKDDIQRKQDFLNNTSEISPIKITSPDRNKKSPSPETSSDYVVIKLSTPVQSNGEPLEKNGSPEFFTDDKVSPDVRNQSPPRTDINLVSSNNTSPSSSLSLKRNRPQVRSCGRAAQMLGLCVPDKLNSIMNQERNDSEEPKRNSPSSTSNPAKRNLKLLYNIGGDTELSNENEENEAFLKFKRKLPAVDSSPSGPILKRKFVDIEDEITLSPASKRKRVSFHDPPVSTTIAVQKYIEPNGLRSPQNSVQKRIEKQLRHYTKQKSPKRLDTAFKLDSVLNRAVESFIDVDVISSNTEDTQTISLETTPAIEIVRASELNDKDPICPLLIECKDPIDNIAAKLSSTTTKSWLVKELQGKIDTVGDLAKMTELEVNRLCIKAPKVKTVKRVLVEYATAFLGRTLDQTINEIDNNISSENDVTVLNGTEPIITNSQQPDCSDNLDNESSFCNTDAKDVCYTQCDAEAQTCNVIFNDTSVQTVEVFLEQSSSQTDDILTSHTSVQTDDTGAIKTADLVGRCLTERDDFINQLGQQLEEPLIKQLAEKLNFETLTDLVIDRLSDTNSSDVLNRVLEVQHTVDESKQLEFLIDYISNRYESKSLILFCSKLLQKVHDKPSAVSIN